ncbi:MAG: Gfo/Idh/MocA family oxidoreductase [Phycisphaerae bacterium]|nr:Gfo/Idh/MocA family oxidoreductase [Phycisphaerae bacterium]
MKSGINRREFLGLAAGATAGAVFPQVVTAAGISGRDIRLGVIGTGNRGQYLTRVMLGHRGIQVPAVCDIVPEKAKHTADFVSKALGKPVETYTKGPEDYLRMLQRDDLDAVLVTTPMQLHAANSVAAMKAGKHVLSEVSAAATLDECWDLIRTVEQTGKTYMMAENCCYYRQVMMVLNMVEQGLFGELTYAECAYVHDCRFLSFNPDGSLTWRGKLHTNFIGNLYPTHAIGPVARWMGINRTDRFKTITAMSSPPRGHAVHAEQKFGKGHAATKNKWIAGDATNALIQTDKGALIEIRYDTSSSRAYNSTTHYLLQGTKAAYLDDGARIYIEGKSTPHKWEPRKKYEQEYDHPLWKKWGKDAEGAGHGGADYFTTRLFLEALRTGGKSPVDVYDAVAWSSIMPLSAASIRAGGQPQEFPDFKKNAKDG